MAEWTFGADTIVAVRRAWELLKYNILEEVASRQLWVEEGDLPLLLAGWETRYQL